jgi:hypothetical protein
MDHPGLKVFTPSITSYLKKGLAEIGSDIVFPASAAEIYASGVCEGVLELDNALSALRLTMNFVMNLGWEAKPDPDIYRYHYENFVLRVIGFVDRAHRLVGSALAMPVKKVEGTGGNAFVQKQIATAYPDVHAALLAVAKAVESYKGPRNELIHSTAFSSRELGLFTSIKHFRVDTGEVDTDELAKLVETLKVLLGALAPHFDMAHQHLQLEGVAGAARKNR